MQIKHIILYLSCCYLLPCYADISLETDTLPQYDIMWVDKYLCSQNKIFRQQLFSTSASNGYYLGISYNTLSKTRNFFTDDTHPVWVANRDTPVDGISAELIVDPTDGLLRLFYEQGNITVSDCPPTDKNTTATILNNGNLVLRMHNPDGSINGTMWQSFDYPTDTLLPGLKLGISKTGHKWALTPWTSKAVPVSGSFLLVGTRMDLAN